MFIVVPSTQISSEAIRKVNRLAKAGLWAITLQIAIGVYLRTHHAGLACPEFPSCSNHFFPIPFQIESLLAFGHRWLGIAMFGLFTHLALATATKLPELVRPARHAFALSIAQIFLGIGSVIGGLDPGTRHLHMGVGYGLWGLLFYIALRTGSFSFFWRRKGQSIGEQGTSPEILKEAKGKLS